MKLIVGLGNPGPNYQKTRHNAGFMVVDRLCEAHAKGEVPRSRFQGALVETTISGEKCLLLKPLTFMNLSGRSVGEAARFYKVDVGRDLLVVTDEVYLPVGRIKLLPGGGTGGHNGLSSVQEHLGSETYPRLRVGVGVLPSGGKPPLIDQADFVLSKFTEDEAPLLEASIRKCVATLELWVGKGIGAAMNYSNSDAPPRPKPQQRESPRQDEREKQDEPGESAD
jgi:PTH1 family peptidyl-tRNA hydrolase